MKAYIPIQLIIVLSFLGATGCRESTRKDQPQKVATQGMLLCEAYARELLKYDIRIDGPTTVGNYSTAQFPKTAFTPEQKEDIQGLLEKYVQLAGRIVRLANTNVVVFPESSEMNARYERAQKYLGEFYALLRPRDLTDSGYETPRVDFAEVNARFVRFGEIIRKHDAMGFDLAKWPESAKVLEKFSTPKLRIIQQDYIQISRDFERSNALGRRNHGWGSPRMQAGLASFAKLGESFEAIKECLEIFIKAREKK